MAYFPLAIKLQKVLVVGGGKIASFKLKKLLDYTDDISVLAPEFSMECEKLFTNHKITKIKKKYEVGDIKNYKFVIVATDCLDLQKDIYKECSNLNILCSCVDLKECSDFIFTSIFQEGDLSISISTNGTSPSFAKYFKSYLKSIIPKSTSEFLKMSKKVRKTLPKGKARMHKLDKMTKDFFEKNMRINP